MLVKERVAPSRINLKIRDPKPKLDKFRHVRVHRIGNRKPKFALSGIKRELRAYKTPFNKIKTVT